MRKPCSLIATPIPYDDESPGSILLRASTKNGYPKPIKLLNVLQSLDNGDVRLSGKLKTIMFRKERFLSACNLLGIIIDESHMAVPGGHRYTFARQNFCGIDMQTKSIRTTTHYCPQCISEKPYFKRQWDHEFITSCTEHNIILVDKCFECHEPISWDREHLLLCKCGAELSDADVVQQVSKSSETVSEILVSKCQEGYESFLDFHQALKAYFGEEHNVPCLEYAAIGYKSELALAEILFDEIRRAEGSRHFHPKLTLIDFMISCNPKLKKVAEIVNEKIAELNEYEVKAYDYGEMLDLKEVAAILGVSNREVIQLRNHDILECYQTKPNAKTRILKSAVNNLLMNLGEIETVNVKKSLTVKDLINDQRFGLNFSNAIKLILDGKIKLVKFSWQDSLLNILVQSPIIFDEPIEFLKELVPLNEFVAFSRLDANIIRDRMREHSCLEYYENNGTKKYLTVENAELLLVFIKERAQLKKTIDRLMPLQPAQIPKLTCRVRSYCGKSENKSISKIEVIPL